MTVTLTPEQEKIVRERLTFGDYEDEFAVLEAAFQELMYREIVKPEDELGIKAAVEKGWAQIERNEVIRFSDNESFVDHFTERLKKRLEERRKP